MPLIALAGFAQLSFLGPTMALVLSGRLLCKQAHEARTGCEWAGKRVGQGEYCGVWFEMLLSAVAAGSRDRRLCPQGPE